MSIHKAGTTAVGKTDLSIQLAKLIGGEIISADSVQVYRYMNIGSAKVDSITRETIKHHLIDVVDVTQPFNVRDYCQLALKAIQDIISRGKVPIVVGGTSFYIHFLISGGTESPVSTEESRKVIDSLLAEDGGDWEKSLSRLEAIDPEYSRIISRNDWYRLKRALDICLQSGQTVTSFKHTSKGIYCHYNPIGLQHEDLPYSCYCLFLTMPRVELFHKIDQRCELILNEGFLEEVVYLVRRHGLQQDSAAGRSIGYRQALEYLSNEHKFTCDSHVIADEISQEMRTKFFEFLRTYQSHTRQLAQQQLTWFKKEANFHWLNLAPNGGKLPIELVANRVKDWLLLDIPLPQEWSGSDLKNLTSLEKEQLKRYTVEQALTIYGCRENIDSTLIRLNDCLKSTL